MQPRQCAAVATNPDDPELVVVLELRNHEVENGWDGSGPLQAAPGFRPLADLADELPPSHYGWVVHLSDGSAQLSGPFGRVDVRSSPSDWAVLRSRQYVAVLGCADLNWGESYFTAMAAGLGQGAVWAATGTIAYVED